MTEIGSMRLRAVALLAGMFVVGVVTGTGLLRAMGPPPPRPGGPPGQPPPGMELYARLGLSPDQMEKAHAVLERHRPELEAIVRDTMPRVRGVQDAVDREVRAFLTPEQAARLEALKRELPPPGLGAPPPGAPGLPPHGPPPPGMPPPGALPPGPPPAP